MERNFQYFSLTPIHTHTGRRRRRRRRKQNDACADEAQRRSRRRKMQRITILSAAVSFAAKISLRDRRSLSGIKHLSSSSPPSATSTSTSSSSSTSSSHPSSLAAPASPSCSDSDLLPANRLLVHGVHLFECPDRVGITAKITECIASRGASILDFGVYVNLDSGRTPAYFARTEFVFDPLQWPRHIMHEDFLRLKAAFNASTSVVRVPKRDSPMKVAVLVSRKDYCAVDLLHQWQDGKIPIQLTCVVSNHTRKENSHIIRFLSRHNIPYHHVPANKEDKYEEEILNIIRETDFLVLAHYMQVLSPDFLRAYGKDIINIHHGLLPSFKGANPYKQAYEAGVKLIGATSHFVTEELDCGPIIEQMVERVSHRDTLTTLAMKSEYLEKICLAKAIKYYCEMRIIRYSGNRTIVFD